MTTPDPEHYSHQRLSGTHFVVDMIQPHVITELLAQETYWQTLNRSSEQDLPDPINFTEIEVGKNQDIAGRHEILAVVHFAPPETQARLWPTLLQVELETKLVSDDPDQFLAVPHELSSFYIRISANDYVRIEPTATIEECIVQLTIVSREALEEQLERSISMPSELADYSAYARLRDFTKIWLTTMDSIAATFGDNETATVHQLKIKVEDMAVQSAKDVSVRFTQPELDASNSADDEEVVAGPDAVAPNEAAPEQSLPEAEVVGVIKTEESMHRIGGLHYPKARLGEFINMIKDDMGRVLYDVKVPPFLIHGPDRNGKTSIIEAFAREIGANIYTIESTDIIASHTGESANKTNQVFDEITNLATTNSEPVVAIIKNIDILIDRQASMAKERKDVIARLCAHIREVAKLYPNRIIITATTSTDPGELDPSVIQSTGMELIYAGLPTLDEREEIWQAIIWGSYVANNGIPDGANAVVVNGELMNNQQGFTLYDPSIHIGLIADVSDGLTGGDFDTILHNARNQQRKALLQSGVPEPINTANVISEIIAFKHKKKLY